MSDVVQDSPELTDLLHQLPRIGLLVVDACRDALTTNSHFSLDEAIDFVKVIKPYRALFVGMCCEIDHDPTCSRLHTLSSECDIEMSLAYDGQTIGPFPLAPDYSILESASVTSASAIAAPPSASSNKRLRESSDSVASQDASEKSTSASTAVAAPVFRSPAPIHQPNSRLFVAGLPPSVTAAELTEKFREFGAVTQDIWIKPGAVYTHVQMESTDAAARAMKACKGLILKGSEITVKLADNRFAKPGEDRWKEKDAPDSDYHSKSSRSSRDDEPLSRDQEARRRAPGLALSQILFFSRVFPHPSFRREDIINKAFPLDRATSSKMAYDRRKILGTSNCLVFFSRLLLFGDFFVQAEI
jgi:hypothetical protein